MQRVFRRGKNIKKKYVLQRETKQKIEMPTGEMPTVERWFLLLLIGALCSFYGCMNF